MTLELDVGGRAIRVSNPDKPYFPGITKADVVRYFLAVGDGILAAVHDRPTMLERWPGGMAGRAIFQRSESPPASRKISPRYGAFDWRSRCRVHSNPKRTPRSCGSSKRRDTST